MPIKRFFLAALAACVLCLGLEAKAPSAFFVRVIVAVANIRAEASSASPVIAQATDGTVLEADAVEGQWYRVKVLSKDKGQMLSGFIYQTTVVLIQGQPVPANPPSPPANTRPADAPSQPAVPSGPAGPPSAYGGWTAGVGAGIMSYWTSWEFSVLESYGRTYYHRWHLFSRTGVAGFLEKRNVMRLGPLAMNLRGEARFGFLGGTDLDLEPEAVGVSDGGSAFGFAVLAKLAYPIRSASGVLLAPFFATGAEFNILGSNGIGNEFYDTEYSKGWSEYIFAIPLCFGAAVDLKGLSLGLEYRYVIMVSGWTDLELSGRETWFYQAQSGSVFQAHLGFRL